MISINKGVEPNYLKSYKKLNNRHYEGGSLNKSEIQKQLLTEQKGLCAYCMGRIKVDDGKPPNMIIEHYIPRNGEHANHDLELEYTNMLGVCKGNKGKDGKLHCDQSKKGALLKVLNPLDKDIETKFKYLKNGRIDTIDGNSNVKDDIDLLNLNEYFLTENRKIIINELIEAYNRIRSFQNLSKRTNFINKRLRFWEKITDGNLQPYCQVAITWLKNKQ